MRLLANTPAERRAGAAVVRSPLADIVQGGPRLLPARPPAELEADLAAATHPDSPNLTHRLHTGSPKAGHASSKSRWAMILGVLAAIIVGAVIFSLLR